MRNAGGIDKIRGGVYDMSIFDIGAEIGENPKNKPFA
jgi:hypothetical protein